MKKKFGYILPFFTTLLLCALVLSSCQKEMEIRVIGNLSNTKMTIASYFTNDTITQTTSGTTGTTETTDTTETTESTEHIHVFGEWDDIGDASCMELVMTTRACECGMMDIGVLSGDHVAGEWVIIKNATKAEPGEREQICVVCGETIATQIIYIDSEGLAYKTVDGEYHVAGIGTCADAVLVIPAYHEDKPVVSIADSAFEQNKDITSVVISSGIRAIGSRAFYMCDTLARVTIPRTVTSIGADAFGECKELFEIGFDGTKAEWDAIEKSEDWDAAVGTHIGGYTVNCLDGSITG